MPGSGAAGSSRSETAQTAATGRPREAVCRRCPGAAAARRSSRAPTVAPALRSGQRPRPGCPTAVASDRCSGPASRTGGTARPPWLRVAASVRRPPHRPSGRARAAPRAEQVCAPLSTAARSWSCPHQWRRTARRAAHHRAAVAGRARPWRSSTRTGRWWARDARGRVRPGRASRPARQRNGSGLAARSSGARARGCEAPHPRRGPRSATATQLRPPRAQARSPVRAPSRPATNRAQRLSRASRSPPRRAGTGSGPTGCCAAAPTTRRRCRRSPSPD